MKENKKIFLPLTLDNSTKSFLSPRQLVLVVLLILAFVVLQMAAFGLNDKLSYSTTLSGWIVLAGDLVVTYILVFIFRKAVLKEDELMRNYKSSKDLQSTDISFCWDIYGIRDNRILYCNGLQAMVVRLSHGYLLDRPENQEAVHRDMCKTAIGNLTKQGYSFLYYNREIKDSNLEPLRESERSLRKFEKQPIYGTLNEIIKHTYKVCDRIANTEQEYYVILAGSMDTISKLDHAVNTFINTLHGGVYVGMDILNDKEIWEFISSLFGISYINPSALLAKKYENTNTSFVEILYIDRDEPEQPSQSVEAEPVLEEEDILL